MSGVEEPGGPDGQGFNLEPKVAKSFLRFAAGFWSGPTAGAAWFLTLALAGSLILSTYATVQMNHWNRWFFDALERKDVATVQSAVLVFFLIIAAMAAVGVAIVLTRETLQVRWRAWLVTRLLDTWLDKQRFYHLNASGKEPPNPEYRISDDTRWATEILVDLGIGLLSALIGGIAFITILWSVGGALTIGGVSVPGYMVWLALAYGITMSVIMAKIGKPLVGRVGAKNEAEGYFRFAMMRLRDNAETVAAMKGGAAEKVILNRFYDNVVTRWLRIVKSHGHVTWITNSSGPMIPIIPLLFAAPKYLAGELTLGQVTQLAAAFIQVQIAISWLVDNYNRIAEWYASARRVMDVVDAGAKVDADAAHRAPERAYRLPPLAPKAGAWTHVIGESGTGKSTLARGLAAQLAPDGSEARLMLLPQRVYVPLTSLRGALAYPYATSSVDDIDACAVLDKVGLASLLPKLDETLRWDQVLTASERQRLGLARVLLQSPDVVVLDDTLAALEESEQVLLATTLRKALPKTAFVSLGQRAAPKGLASEELVLERGATGLVLRRVSDLVPA